MRGAVGVGVGVGVSSWRGAWEVYVRGVCLWCSRGRTGRGCKGWGVAAFAPSENVTFVAHMSVCSSRKLGTVTQINCLMAASSIKTQQSVAGPPSRGLQHRVGLQAQQHLEPWKVCGSVHGGLVTSETVSTRDRSWLAHADCVTGRAHVLATHSS